MAVSVPGAGAAVAPTVVHSKSTVAEPPEMSVAATALALEKVRAGKPAMLATRDLAA